MASPRVVADASVLIVLTKILRMNLLREVYGNVGIGPVVKAEVIDQGRQMNVGGIELVEQALEDGWLSVMRPSSEERRLVLRLRGTTRLDGAEAEGIALAYHRDLPLIVDDKDARRVSGSLGITYLGTAGVFLEAYLDRLLTLAQLEDAIADLTGVLWLSPAVVTTILKKAREVAR